jgi:peptidyl-dipeptidase Dcp
MQNPLIDFYKTKTFSTPDEALPFDKLERDHFLPALEFAIEQARKKIAQIKSESVATFENTILALESSSELFDLVTGTYHNLFNAEADAEFQALAKNIAPIEADFSNEVILDSKLFSQIEFIHKNAEAANLTKEQKKLTEKYYRNYVKNGATLPDDKKQELKEIDQQLSTLSPQFAENLLKATNAFDLLITNSTDLKGLPESVIEAASHEAEKKGHKGKWLITLQAPSMIPFLQYSDSRELRQKVWYAYATRCTQNEVSNFPIIQKIINLRHKRAQLLGFKNWADFMLQDRMANSITTVTDFLKKLTGPSKKVAEKEIQELKAFKKSLEGTDELQPWDFAYFSEKLKQRKFKFSEEELRPYFKLESVVAGVFEHARRLFGITFKEVFDVPKYHQDVRVFEVKEEGSNKFVGTLYTDFFPRETKKSGAWMTAFREQGLWSGKVRRPQISIVCNFTKPTAHKPSLLTMDEVLTLFHEFGHALHGLLSDCHYRSLAGTNVYWDFVELPSQIMENWVWEKETLDIFARHYQTGEAIPVELVTKIKKAQKFQAGYASVRQLQFACLDMAWHTTDPRDISDLDAFEDKTTQPLRVLPRVPGTNTSVTFGHIFAGGYSSGYYSYKWAEVLDADAFEFFKEKGLYNKELAKQFQKQILSKGGSEHPMELYKNFRGREPDPDALLRRDGLLNL